MTVSIKESSNQKINKIGKWYLSNKKERLQGNDAQIFDATHLNQQAIIKLPQAKSSSLLAFDRELRALNKMKGDPNVVNLLDSGNDPSLKLPYIIIEDGGPTIADKLWLEGWAPTFNEIKSILKLMKQSLDKAHEMGFVHGDIKAANICYSKGQVNLIDWGNSYEIGEKRHIGALAHHQPPYPYWTEATDIYGLAVLAFQMLFHGEFLEFLVSKDRRLITPRRKLNTSKVEVFLKIICLITDWSKCPKWDNGGLLWTIK
jgi:serine/threonine protein kinase